MNVYNMLGVLPLALQYGFGTVREFLDGAQAVLVIMIMMIMLTINIMIITINATVISILIMVMILIITMVIHKQYCQ